MVAKIATVRVDSSRCASRIVPGIFRGCWRNQMVVTRTPALPAVQPARTAAREALSDCGSYCQRDGKVEQHRVGEFAGCEIVARRR